MVYIFIEVIFFFSCYIQIFEITNSIATRSTELAFKMLMAVDSWYFYEAPHAALGTVKNTIGMLTHLILTTTLPKR